MHVIPFAERLPKSGMSAEEKAAALETIDELRAQIERDEIDGLAWCAVGNDFIYHGHAGAGNDFYRLAGGLGALVDYLTYIYHTAELVDE